MDRNNLNLDSDLFKAMNIIEDIKEDIKDNDYLQLSNILGNIYKNSRHEPTNSCLLSIHNNILKSYIDFFNLNVNIPPHKKIKIIKYFKRLDSAFRTDEYKAPTMTNNNIDDTFILIQDIRDNLYLQSCRNNLRNYIKNMIIHETLNIEFNGTDTSILEIYNSIYEEIDKIDSDINKFLSSGWLIQSHLSKLLSMLFK